MSAYRRPRYRLAAVLLLLVVLHFTLRPLLGDDPRPKPDFLILALLVYANRSTPGRASVAGFLVGLLSDALTPVAFGSGALAHTIVGYLAAWGKAVFFADNLMVSAGFFFGGTWVRDVLAMLAGGHVGGAAFTWQVLVWSPLKAATTAVVGVAVLLVFRRWLEMRMAE